MQAIDGAGGQGAYHVSTGGDYAIEELFEATRGHPGHQARPAGRGPAPGRGRRIHDSPGPGQHAEDFGWQTTVPLEEGVRAAIEYYQRFGITETYTHLKLERAARMTTRASVRGARALVVGGAGFVGSNLVRALVRRGATSVVVVDNLLSSERTDVLELPA